MSYELVHNCVDAGDQIPPSLPCLPQAGFTKGRNSPLCKRVGRGDFRKNMSSILWTPYYVLGETDTFSYWLVPRNRSTWVSLSHLSGFLRDCSCLNNFSPAREPLPQM